MQLQRQAQIRTPPTAAQATGHTVRFNCVAGLYSCAAGSYGIAAEGCSVLLWYQNNAHVLCDEDTSEQARAVLDRIKRAINAGEVEIDVEALRPKRER